MGQFSKVLLAIDNAHMWHAKQKHVNSNMFMMKC